MAVIDRSNSTDQQFAAQATKPKFFVIDDVLHYQAKAGDELTFDLDFDSAILDKIFAGDLEEREQFMLLIESLGDDMVARVRQMGALEQMRLITGFFSEFAKAVGAPLGESVSSSDS